jgi:hypothetical protein
VRDDSRLRLRRADTSPFFVPRHMPSASHKPEPAVVLTVLLRYRFTLLCAASCRAGFVKKR